MKTKHTPGNWETTIQDNERFVFSETNGAICKLPVAYGNNFYYEEAEANAKLIAAAPDLLKACKSALSLLQELYTEDIISGWSGEAQLESAIKKATE